MRRVLDRAFLPPPHLRLLVDANGSWGHRATAVTGARRPARCGVATCESGSAVRAPLYGQRGRMSVLLPARLLLPSSRDTHSS